MTVGIAVFSVALCDLQIDTNRFIIDYNHNIYSPSRRNLLKSFFLLQ